MVNRLRETHKEEIQSGRVRDGGDSDSERAEEEKRGGKNRRTLFTERRR